MAQPKKTLWRKRDPGQKLSIIMFGVCMAAAAAFMAYALVFRVGSGDWVKTLAPVGFFLSLIGLLLEWRRRNAR